MTRELSPFFISPPVPKEMSPGCGDRDCKQTFCSRLKQNCLVNNKINYCWIVFSSWSQRQHLVGWGRRQTSSCLEIVSLALAVCHKPYKKVALAWCSRSFPMSQRCIKWLPKMSCMSFLLLCCNFSSCTPIFCNLHDSFQNQSSDNALSDSEILYCCSILKVTRELYSQRYNQHSCVH